MKFRLKSSDTIFYIIVFILLTAFFLIVLYPCLFVLAASLSSASAVKSGKVILWPVDFTTIGYEVVFKTRNVWVGYANSLFYVVAGTSIAMVVTMICAYVMARPDLPGRRIFMMLFTFTMMFSGGMIPEYLLIKNLGMLNTRWAIIIPSAMSVYNMILARTYIQTNIPKEMLEAAQMDGCSDIKFFFRIVLPLSKAIMAVLVLFYAVAQWNQYFAPMIYLRNRNLFPLTIYLKEILMNAEVDSDLVSDPELQKKLADLANVMKYALIVVSLIPILIIYPFIQKYFIKGVMIGSVKG